MTRSLAVLGQGHQRLIHQIHVVLVDVQPQQPKPPSGGPANAVEKFQGVGDQIVRVLVALLRVQKVLVGNIFIFIYLICIYFYLVYHISTYMYL